MRVPTDLDARLKVLMDMAVDDHDGPPEGRPARLRHMGEGGALRPFNFRAVRLGASNAYTSLLRVLSRRGLRIPDEMRQQVLACTDSRQLETWIDRAVTATSVQDVFG